MDVGYSVCMTVARPDLRRYVVKGYADRRFNEFEIRQMTKVEL